MTVLFGIAVAILFYASALAQAGFFTHYLLFGAAPSLIFALYFVLVFFERRDSLLPLIAYALTAGILCDILSPLDIGWSPVVLLALAWTIRRIQDMLQDTGDSYQIARYLLLFSATYIVYQGFISLIIFNGDALNALESIFSLTGFSGLAYTATVACAAFYVSQELQNKKIWR